MNKFISRSENETLALGRNFAKILSGGFVILLYGDLGTGKTVFVRGVCEALNISGVRSPSFTLINEYSRESGITGGEGVRGNGFQGCPRDSNKKFFSVIHADLYRLDENNADSIGLEEFCGLDDFVVFIEWPERLKGIISDEIIKISFTAINESEREIKFSAQGLKSEEAISKL